MKRLSKNNAWKFISTTKLVRTASYTHHLLVIYIDKFNSDDLHPADATMILLSYCKMKIIKPELFEVLEANFSNKLDQAKPKDVATYSHAHSMLCEELLS